jgi:radical SAM superfamily enzyme YgiQ (UPF0313 family)
MLDILIISVPGINSRQAPAAPALLKASVEKAGFSCLTADYNIRLYTDSKLIDELETYFSTGLNQEQLPHAQELINQWSQEIIALNPKYLGISVFTYQSKIATELFCRAIKSQSNIQIILGGQGLSSGSIQGSSDFGREMVEKKLADYWIRSEGEISLVELLKGNTTYPGINSDSFKQIDDLDSIPFPNYDNYDFEVYENRSLPVTGSRGCVRACSFCDIHEHWKYRYRTGQNMSNEVLMLSEKYDIHHFNFSDSLINGNLKEFKKFIAILAKHNSTATKKITWTSQYIVRSSSQLDDSYWSNLALSGVTNLGIGVETGSDRVRMHMKKKFNNKDLDYTMEMLDKYNISCTFLIVVGYPTETEEDFQDTLDMFTRYKPLANRIIQNINLGSTLGILPGTDLYKNASNYHIELDVHESNWVNLDNESLTLEIRLNRRHRLYDHVVQLGYYMKPDSAKYMLKILEDNLETFNKRTKIKKMIRIKNSSSKL